MLPSLLAEFEGKVNLIYIDPPFDTGADFSYTARVPDRPETHGDDSVEFTKEPSIIEQKAYRDTWGRGLDSYLGWFHETVVFLYELLAEDGSLFVHMDWHVGHYAKCVVDELFGNDGFLEEIIWNYGSPSGGRSSGAKLVKAHDTIFRYPKQRGSHKYHAVYLPYSEKYIKDWFKFADESGRRFQRRMRGRNADGSIHWEKQFLDESKGVPASTVWTDIQQVYADPRAYKANTTSEILDYPTQKPERLVSRILEMASDEGDLVLDCFCGSGTTAAVAEKLKRRWIACDLSRFAIHTTRKRLLSIPGVRPFVVQNLGKYERQLWQAGEFGNGRAAERQTAYVQFILKLYEARPVQGHAWLHGIRAGRMVHVGAVDAPVSTGDVTNIAAEFRKAVGKGQDAPARNGVDVLGWDFAFELNEVAKQQAAAANIAMRFFHIPRDVMDKKAVEQGDVKFFELAALLVEVKAQKREVALKLADFVIPPDDVPEEARRAVKHWSQWIDYWAVDWDNKGDTFHNEWQTYRTRKENKLALEASHAYPEPGEYIVVVKVIDILGNDTTKTVKVKVK